MPTHNDIKTAAYLDLIINYAEAHLRIRLKRTGDRRYGGSVRSMRIPRTVSACMSMVTMWSGFIVSASSINASAKKHQPETDKPINVSFISCGPAGQRNVVFSPAEGEATAWYSDEASPTEYYYDVDDLMPLLSYDHGNNAMLEQTINEITKLMEARTTEPQSDTVFTIPVKFLQTEAYTDLGPALFPWLQLVIEQQAKKRRVRQTDAVLAEWLIPTRRTITTYKRMLNELGYLKIDTSTRPQRLSVRYFPK